MKNIRAKSAKLAHDIWSRWMKYMFTQTKGQGRFLEEQVIPKEKVDRWNRQMNTEFDNLSPEEQKSDYDIADELIGPVFEPLLKELVKLKNEKTATYQGEYILSSDVEFALDLIDKGHRLIIIAWNREEEDIIGWLHKENESDEYLLGGQLLSKEMLLAEWLRWDLKYIVQEVGSSDYNKINSLIKYQKQYCVDFKDGQLSDGFHTFDDLYEFRKVYHALLFNEWANSMQYKDEENRYDVHKSWLHHNGEKPFGGGWFVVCAMLPDGQITNHYKTEDWDLFDIPETPKAKYEFDGHTSKDVLERLKFLLK